MFITASGFSAQELKMLISAGITASESYVREKGVSLVANLGVVRNAYSTNGSSFGHHPFTLSSLLFSPLRMVRLVTSIMPLDYK